MTDQEFEELKPEEVRHVQELRFSLSTFAIIVAIVSAFATTAARYRYDPRLKSYDPTWQSWQEQRRRLDQQLEQERQRQWTPPIEYTRGWPV